MLAEKTSRRDGREVFCCVSPTFKETGVKLGVGDWRWFYFFYFYFFN